MASALPPSEQRLRRVFVVEDESMIADLIGFMLEDLGCEVAGVAGDLGEAMAMAEGVEADAALLDVNLAGREVFPVAERLASRGMPLVFSTGYGVGGLPPEWSGRPVLSKPFEQEDLAEALARAG